MPVFTNDQIATQLTNNALTPGGTALPKFNVAPGGSLAVNITGLTVDGQAMVRAALAVWSDATGITFNEVTTGQKITFDDAGAATLTTRATAVGGFTPTATVNFASSLVPGTSLDSDAYQIYVREIGKALGLNPAALYDSTPDFATERQYDNDSRHNSVMSLFTQDANTVLTDSDARVMGPMIADILAIQSIYGAVSTTRTGDTTYGFGSNAGRDQYDATLYNSVSYVVLDNGGIDTLNYSGFTQNQVISLVAETFSNVGGLVGNVGIARGSVIENAIGGTGADTITGNSANNVLDGGVDTASDTLTGGAGDDSIYVRSTNDVVVEVASGGYDTVFADVSQTLSANADVELLRATNYASVNDIILRGSSIAQAIVGNAGSNTLLGFGGEDTLYGLAGNDAIDGGTGTDTMIGDIGSDTYYADVTTDSITESNANIAVGGNDTVNFSGTTGTFVLGANLERLNLTGGSATSGEGNGLANIMFGNSAANTLTGFAGADSIDGAAGDDTLVGGDGNDTYYANVITDLIVEANSSLAVGGNDTVNFNGTGGTFVLDANIENLTLAGNFAVSGTGNELNNILIGNASANTLTGLAGNDTITGGAGIDTMVGGDGNDIYFADRFDDVITETNAVLATGGNEYVYFNGTSGTMTLGLNVENLIMQGGSAINATGNISNNIIVGNGAANTLSGLGGNDYIDGGLGDDIMNGGDGNDTYTVNVVADTVTETNAVLATGGTDLVRFAGATGIYVLGANVENLTLLGGSAISGTGNADANTLLGNSAANTLSGLAGADILSANAGLDTMIGGDGDDIYFADVTGDIITESNAAILTGGDDTVNFYGTSGTFLLSTNVERLVLQGVSAINGTGNALANTMTGNANVNILDGGLGIDTMNGADGTDTYFADVVGDLISETNSVLATGGNDLVNFTGTTGTFTLGTNIERLTLQGTAVTSGTGNALANVLIGNSAANTLSGLAGNDTISGGTGIDTMLGGDGNDLYYADVFNDVVTESNAVLATGGDDTVTFIGTTGTFTLDLNIENLTILTNSIGVNGTGNVLNNILTGGNAANTLSGQGGNDTINGKLGNDTLIGGLGTDTFLFNSALSFSQNRDTILDFNVVDDTIQLENAIFTMLTSTGVLAANLFKNTSTGTIDADDRILYNDATGAISYDTDGSGAAVAINFAVLTGSPTITQADFFVI